ncbi:MAG: RNA polymerase sigma factor [Myxococcales bacterium]
MAEWPSARELYDREFVYVWNALRRLGIRGGDLEDLTQEVFVTALRRLPTYDPARPLRPWLFGIAVRHASDFRKLARHRREVPTEDGREVADDRASPEAAAGASQARALVLRALEELEEDRRAVFVMHELSGHPIPEVAEALDVPLNTAYSRLRLARADFRAAVARLKGDT